MTLPYTPLGVHGPLRIYCVHIGTMDKKGCEPEPLYNSHITETSCEVSAFSWVLYGFNNGHFILTTCTHVIPFSVVLVSAPLWQKGLCFVNSRPVHIYFGLAPRAFAVYRGLGCF